MDRDHADRRPAVLFRRAGHPRREALADPAGTRRRRAEQSGLHPLDLGLLALDACRSSSCANTQALKRAGITRDTVSPVATLTIEKDANGDPTGVFIENEMQPIAELIWFREATEFTRADRARALPHSAQAYHAFGTTSVFEEHGVANEVLRAYKDAWRAGTLTMRSALVFSPNWKAVGDAPLGPFIEAWAGWLGEPGLGDDRLKMTGLYIDIGHSPADDVRAAAAPYTGWAGFNYDTGLPRARVKEVLLACARNDIRVVAIANISPGLHRSLRGGRPRGPAQGPALGARAHQRALAPRHRAHRAHGARRHDRTPTRTSTRKATPGRRSCRRSSRRDHAGARPPRRGRERRRSRPTTCRCRCSGRSGRRWRGSPASPMRRRARTGAHAGGGAALRDR